MIKLLYSEFYVFVLCDIKMLLKIISVQCYEDSVTLLLLCFDHSFILIFNTKNITLPISSGVLHIFLIFERDWTQ